MTPKCIYDCIVFDLDGTLLSSSERSNKDTHKISFNDMHGDIMELFVHKRPGFDELLKKCFEISKVGIWSMGQQGYVEAVIGLFPQRPIFVYNWRDCDRNSKRPKSIIFKKLDNIPYIGNIIMIDDKYDVLEPSPRINTHIVSEWDPEDKDDKVLYDLMSTLFI